MMRDTTETDTNDRDELLAFFSALSDEDRLSIAGTITRQTASTAEIAAACGLRQQDAARHLAVLERTGIVSRAENGGAAWRLDVDHLRERRRALLARQREAPTGAAVDATEAERRVLASFVEGDRLRDIPVAREKKLVVLRWLVGMFEPGERYPEREVNDILKRHHPDSASLRRALVDHGLMRREAGIYWRAEDDDRR